MSNICRKQPKHHPTSRKIPRTHLYIYLYFYGRAPASSGRDLDASKRSRDVATPKKRTLGLTPSSFSKVKPPETPKHVFGDPRNICICRVGAKSDK